MVVRTSSGTVYTLEDGWLTRMRVEGTDSQPMRKDGEPARVIYAPEPVVGYRWNVVIQIRVDGVDTVRSTSPVVEVS